MAKNTCGLADDATIPQVNVNFMTDAEKAEVAKLKEDMYQRATAALRLHLPWSFKRTVDYHPWDLRPQWLEPSDASLYDRQGTAANWPPRGGQRRMYESCCS